MNLKIRLVCLSFCSVLIGQPLVAQTSCSWGTMGGGVPGPYSVINTTLVWDSGTGAALYVGGSYTTIGGVPANRIAWWDGATYHALGAGLNAGCVCMTVHDDGTGPALFAGGLFTMAGGMPALRIAKWDGTTWSPLGAGLDATCSAMLSWNGSLYVCGSFQNAGGVPASRVARWDGAAWYPVGAGVDASCLALGLYDDGTGEALYAGGQFSNAGGAPAANIAKWDGATWSPLGAGRNGRVNTLEVFDDGTGPKLFVGGYFGGAIAHWDGFNWTALGTGADNSVYDIQPFDEGNGTVLLCGGRFLTAGGIPAARLARWDGSTWSEFGGGADGTVWTLTVQPSPTGPTLAVAGAFFNLQAGTLAVGALAEWNCGSWFSVSMSQPGGAGAPTYVTNVNLTPDVEYYNIFSLEPCMGAGGPYLGLCATNPTFLLQQFLLPVGTVPFHFRAPSSYIIHGPYLLPTLTVDAVSFQWTSGTLVAVSPVSTFTVQ